MSRDKLLSLEDARKTGQIDRFCEERQSQADGRFWPLLEAAAKGLPKVQQTSSQGVSGDCSGTQTRQDKPEGI